MTDSYMRLYFPTRDAAGAPIKARSARLVALENRLVTEVGGYTTTPGRGGYRMEDGSAMHEAVDVVEFFSTRAYALSLAIDLCMQLGQEAVLLLVDGEAHFISECPPLATLIEFSDLQPAAAGT